MPQPIHELKPLETEITEIRNFTKEIVITNESFLTLSRIDCIYSCFFFLLIQWRLRRQIMRRKEFFFRKKEMIKG